MNYRLTSIRSRDVETVLRKLGFRRCNRKTRLFVHDEDDLATSLPDDPEWEFSDLHLEHILRDIRLTERKFRELLKAF